MDFDLVRTINIYTLATTGCSLSDYEVIFYSEDYQHNIDVSKPMKYVEIPNCFNCKVHEFDIDFDSKKIWIKSEVVKHGKI